MLKLNDLIAHEKRLTEIISHAQKELDAIRLLISGMQMRSEVGGGSAPVSSDQRTNLPVFIRRLIDNSSTDWHTTKSVMEQVFKEGIRDRSKKANIRATVSGYLRKFYDAGLLERRNIGSPESPRYKYRKRGSEELSLS